MKRNEPGVKGFPSAFPEVIKAMESFWGEGILPSRGGCTESSWALRS